MFEGEVGDINVKKELGCLFVYVVVVYAFNSECIRYAKCVD